MSCYLSRLQTGSVSFYLMHIQFSKENEKNKKTDAQEKDLLNIIGQQKVELDLKKKRYSKANS